MERHLDLPAGIYPGQALPEETRKLIVDATPLKGIGTADDVAAAVVYLASPQARFVTGITLPVDGGYLVQNI